MWINLGTKKEENKVWVDWFSNKNTQYRVEWIDHRGVNLGVNKELTHFLLTQLQNKAKLDLRKSKNPTEDAKTWKPTFGQAKKSNIEKLKDQILKLNAEEQKEIKGLL